VALPRGCGEAPVAENATIYPGQGKGYGPSGPIEQIQASWNITYQLMLDTFPFINKAKSWILGTTQTGCNRRLSGSVDRVLQLTILAFQQWAHETRSVAEANLGHHLGSEPANHQAPLDEDLMQ
jgi:hypothetical protein